MLTRECCKPPCGLRTPLQGFFCLRQAAPWYFLNEQSGSRGKAAFLLLEQHTGQDAGQKRPSHADRSGAAATLYPPTSFAATDVENGPLVRFPFLPANPTFFFPFPLFSLWEMPGFVRFF
eukprot:RCo032514